MKKNASPALPRPDLRLAQDLLVSLLSLPGGSGCEGEVAEFIIAKLRGAGVAEEAIMIDRANRRSPLGGQVGNLTCKLPGTAPGPRRLLSAHMDTVPLCAGAKPIVRGKLIVPAAGKKPSAAGFSGRDAHRGGNPRRGRRKKAARPKTALGADDRAGVAVVLATALEVVRHRLPHPPLTFLWTVQEEVGLLGARHARLGTLGRPRLAFNFDGGSAEKLTVGATGGYRVDIRVHGLAAHAGCAPEEGISAIAIASLAIARLQQEGWHGRVSKNGRQGTCNVGVIRGGDATNVVTPYVEVRAEARSHDSAFRRRIVRAVEQAFRKAANSVRNNRGAAGKVEIDGRLDYEAFRLADDEPCILAAEAAVRGEGGRPIRAVCDGGLDANWLTARLVPTVTLGCGQRNAHTVNETLDLHQFRLACRIALRLATATANG